MSTNTTLWNCVLNQKVEGGESKSWGLYGASAESFYGFTLFGVTESRLTQMELSTGWQNGDSSQGAVTITVKNNGSQAIRCNVRAVAISGEGNDEQAIGSEAVAL